MAGLSRPTLLSNPANRGSAVCSEEVAVKAHPQALDCDPDIAIFAESSLCAGQQERHSDNDRRYSCGESTGAQLALKNLIQKRHAKTEPLQQRKVADLALMLSSLAERRNLANRNGSGHQYSCGESTDAQFAMKHSIQKQDAKTELQQQCNDVDLTLRLSSLAASDVALAEKKVSMNAVNEAAVAKLAAAASQEAALKAATEAAAAAQVAALKAASAAAVAEQEAALKAANDAAGAALKAVSGAAVADKVAALRAARDAMEAALKVASEAAAADKEVAVTAANEAAAADLAAALTAARRNLACARHLCLE